MRVYDRVHGEIILDDVLTFIATHPIFFRLDHVRQLGGCFFVYPSTTHTRREHSLGVCHLAGEVGIHLKRLYPNLVDDDDIICLKIAGLTHDLGHGPFSHTFEEYMKHHHFEWSHETMACDLLHGVLQEGVRRCDPFKTGTFHQHYEFIKLMITGLSEHAPWPGVEIVGRTGEKRFLLDIVHNRTSGVDVDKWDYLCRDSVSAFGASHPLALSRLIQSIRVVDGWRLAFDKHVSFEMAEMYALRARLHRNVYQHRAVILVESLIVDLMNAIDAVLPPDSRFHAIALDANRFATLTDASVLSHERIADPDVRSAYHALMNWHSHLHSHFSVVLPTLPKCMVCRQETELRASFCINCGNSTKDRKGVVDPSSGLRVAPLCLWSDNDIASHFRKCIGQMDARVHIQDVKCGKGVSVTDPYGQKWLDFDPLSNVMFVDSHDRITRVDSVSHHVPFVRHIRTVHVFLKMGTIGVTKSLLDDLLTIDAC